jgi:hypothetical protein
MTDENEAAAKVDKHARGRFSRVRAFGELRDVLRPESNRRTGKYIRDGRQQNVGRTHGNIDVRIVTGTRRDSAGEIPRERDRTVHFPVSNNECLSGHDEAWDFLLRGEKGGKA